MDRFQHFRPVPTRTQHKGVQRRGSFLRTKKARVAKMGSVPGRKSISQLSKTTATDRQSCEVGDYSRIRQLNRHSRKTTSSCTWCSNWQSQMQMNAKRIRGESLRNLQANSKKSSLRHLRELRLGNSMALMICAKESSSARHGVVHARRVTPLPAATLQTCKALQSIDLLSQQAESAYPAATAKTQIKTSKRTLQPR